MHKADVKKGSLLSRYLCPQLYALVGICNSNLDIQYSLPLTVGVVRPRPAPARVVGHENLLVRKPGPKWFSHMKHLFASKNIHLKVCLPKHLPGSSWKQEWLLANLATGPRPATAITGCSSTVGVAGPVGRERVWRGSFCPHCLPYSPTLAGCLTILTSLPSLPDCAAPPPGRAARGRRATFSEVEPARQSQVTNCTKGKG